MSTFARILMALIKKGRTDGLAEKIDVFYAAGKLTDEEYAELVEALPKETATE